MAAANVVLQLAFPRVEAKLLYCLLPGIVGRNGLHPADDFIRFMTRPSKHLGYSFLCRKNNRKIIRPSLFEKNAFQILGSIRRQ